MSASSSSSNLKLEQKTWMFQYQNNRNVQYPIAYEVASNPDNTNKDVVPILLLNGFGVGSFHQHRLMRQLLEQQRQSQQSTLNDKQLVVYGIDYLGQGKSWPTNCNDGQSDDERNLGYSADMWLDQLSQFIQEVIVPTSSTGKVHICGNSVGGYLATILTFRHPSLVSSLCLLNATPVWGLNLPFWDGTLPAPPVPKAIGRALFDTIRDENVVDQYLDVAYVHREAFDGSFDDSFDGSWGSGDDVVVVGKGVDLGSKIIGCTEGNGGHAAFASILWSPPASQVGGDDEQCPSPSSPMGFYDALEQLPVDVLLLFGSDDQWCTPAVAKRMHTTLARGRNGSAQQRYVALDNVGHCPNHEASTAVAKVLLPWIEDSLVLPDIINKPIVVHEPWGNVSIREVSLEESEKLSVVDRIVSQMVG
eukprot:scaffold696_cov197-Alexandrium_tamarense.AAC.3